MSIYVNVAYIIVHHDWTRQLKSCTRERGTSHTRAPGVNITITQRINQHIDTNLRIIRSQSNTVMEVYPVALVTVLITMVTCRPTSPKSQTSVSSRSHYRSLRDASHATSDLLHHSKRAFQFLCGHKSHILPTFDEELSTCHGFAKFLNSYHRERLNLPVVQDIHLPTSRSFSLQLKHVLTQSVRIMTSYQYVITNVTTLESRRLCQHHHGRDVCDIQCSDDVTLTETDVREGSKFWCRCDQLARRVRAAQDTYIQALRSLRMPVPEPSVEPDVSVLPSSRDSHVVSYHFAALHSLSTQTTHIENALSFVNNLARHEVL